jgi:branched-chain amino acid transport system ATP-binding protein
MRILEGENVCKNFGGLTAVSHVNFQVNQGEIFGLIGPNGAGKTTLFNLISGALVPSPGLVKFKNQNITRLKPHQICRAGIARTFQSIKIFTNMTVKQNVTLGSLFGAFTRTPAAEVEKETAGILEFLGLSAVSAVPAKDLTLAKQKRLELARALATKPELLMLDELMAGLNSTEVGEAMELVTRIRGQGITVIMIEHVMKAIMSVCDRIMVLHHGEKIAEGTPADIASSKTVIDIYLGE